MVMKQKSKLQLATERLNRANAKMREVLNQVPGKNYILTTEIRSAQPVTIDFDGLRDYQKKALAAVSITKRAARLIRENSSYGKTNHSPIGPSDTEKVSKILHEIDEAGK